MSTSAINTTFYFFGAILGFVTLITTFSTYRRTFSASGTCVPKRLAMKTSPGKTPLNKRLRWTENAINKNILLQRL
jgi:hypothetical protein